MVFRRLDDVVFINNEKFLLSDVTSVLSSYDKASYKVHYYDGERHYCSDGRNQVGFEIPYDYAERLLSHLPEIRLCRTQRENDEKYFQSLRDSRG